MAIGENAINIRRCCGGVIDSILDWQLINVVVCRSNRDSGSEMAIELHTLLALLSHRIATAPISSGVHDDGRGSPPKYTL